MIEDAYMTFYFTIKDQLPGILVKTTISNQSRISSTDNVCCYTVEN